MKARIGAQDVVGDEEVVEAQRLDSADELGNGADVAAALGLRKDHADLHPGPPVAQGLYFLGVSDPSVRPSAWRVVAAATALNLPFGSLYAFSVFLKPLEALLGLSRADLAFVFALAAAGFGIGMNVAPYVYRLASPPVLVLGCTVSSAL